MIEVTFQDCVCRRYGVQCVVCGEQYLLHLNREQFERWKHGELVQNAFPEMDKGWRELLISHTCPICFAKMRVAKT